ncbi:MAG: hypothetical protein JST52_06225 [Bacteroidetes bacterium]|nr:hypothetical protein [Bacteroidota bacterium]MBS1740217.1 hypothetical protein [Bacteroidota bacterium]
MKRIFLTLGILFLQIGYLIACPVCERNQPKILRGITHGAGPESNWDYLIVWTTVLIVLATLFFSIKWILKPGEKSEQHIKRFILNND